MCTKSRSSSFCCNLGWLLLGLGIGLVILGSSAIKYMVNNVIGKALVIDTTDFSKDTFVNSNVTYKVTLWSVDNVGDVLINGTKPKLSQKGPYIFTKVQHKFNLTMVDDNQKYSYNRWNEYEPVDGNTYLTDYVNAINPFYLTAVFASFGSQGALGAYMTSNVWVKVNANMFDTDSLLMQSVRVLSIKLHLTRIKQYFISGLGLTSSDFINQFYNMNATYFGGNAISNSGFLGANYVGFEIKPYGELPAALAVALLASDETSSISLMSTLGMTTWGTALGASSTSQAAAQTSLITQIAALNPGPLTSAQCYGIVGLYIADKLNATSSVSAAYLYLVSDTMFKAASLAVDAGDYPATWADLGKYQFGYGVISLAFSSQTAKSMSQLGLPGVTIPTEYYWYSSSKSLTGSVYSTLYLNQTKAFFDIIATPTALGTFTALLAAAKASSVFTTFLGLYNNLLWPYKDSLVILGTFLSVFTTFLYDIVPASFGMGQEFRISTLPLTLDSNGMLPSNGGMFTRRTAEEMLFGFTDSLGALINTPFAGLIGKKVSNLTDYLTSLGASKPLTVVQTSGLGRTGYGKYVSYNGVKSASLRSDVGASCPASGSCALWKNPEVISGSYDGLAWESFHADDIPVPTYPVLDTTTIRVVNLTYDSNVNVKNSPTRRYILNSQNLKNASVYEDNDNYLVYFGSGAVPVGNAGSGGPAFASAPHFYGADAIFTDAVDSSSYTPTFADHGTTVDVEPTTGLTIQAAKRLQASFAFRSSYLNYPNSAAMFTGNSGLIYLPSYWAEESNVIGDSDAATLESAVNSPVYIAKILSIVLLCVGSLFVLIGALLSYFATTDNAQVTPM